MVNRPGDVVRRPPGGPGAVAAAGGVPGGDLQQLVPHPVGRPDRGIAGEQASVGVRLEDATAGEAHQVAAGQVHVRPVGALDEPDPGQVPGVYGAADAADRLVVLDQGLAGVGKWTGQLRPPVSAGEPEPDRRDRRRRGYVAAGRRREADHAPRPRLEPVGPVAGEGSDVAREGDQVGVVRSVRRVVDGQLEVPPRAGPQGVLLDRSHRHRRRARTRLGRPRRDEIRAAADDHTDDETDSDTDGRDDGDGKPHASVAHPRGHDSERTPGGQSLLARAATKSSLSSTAAGMTNG